MLAASLLATIVGSRVAPFGGLGPTRGGGATASTGQLAGGAPALAATKVDSLVVDADGDGRVDPGDRVRYTITLTNQGAEALNVTLADTVGPSSTLVPGSVSATPVPHDDNYAWYGNLAFAVDGSPARPGLLANDEDPDGDLLVVHAPSFPATSAQGGNLALVNAATGTFNYAPPPGFSGVDTFVYTVVDDNGNPASATARLTLDGVVWFVDDSNTTPPHLGTQADPFQGLASLGGAGDPDQPGDWIFVFADDGTPYGGGLALEAEQRLIGEAAGLALGGFTIVAPGGRPRIGNAGGPGLTLASDNLLAGFDVVGTAGAGITGSNFGTLTATGLAVSNAGGAALALVGGTLDASFTTLSSTGTAGQPGLRLVDLGGSLLVSGATSLSAPAGLGVEIDDLAPGSSFVFGDLAVLQRGSHGISIVDHDGAALSFRDVDVANPTGAGGNGVWVRPSGAGATSSGPISFASLDVRDTNATINRTDADSNGIPGEENHDGHGVYLLDHTGGFRLTASGPQGNGGTLRNLQGDGIALLRSGGLELDRVTIDNVGTSNQATVSVDNAGIWALDLIGSNRIRNSTISRFQDGGVAGGSAHGIQVTNDGVSFTELRITDTSFWNDNLLLGDDAIGVVTRGTVNGALVVESLFPVGHPSNRSELHHLSGSGVEVVKNGGGTFSTTVLASTFRDAISSGGFGGVELASSGSGVMSNRVEGCLFLALYPLAVNNSGVLTLFAAGSTDFDATVHANTFGSASQRTSDGRGAIRAAADTAGAGMVTDFDVTISDNRIDDTNREAISLLLRGDAVPAASGREMDLVVTGNLIGTITPVANDDGLGREGIEVVASGAAKIVNLRLEGNTVVNFVDSSSDESLDVNAEDATTINLIARGNTFDQAGGAGGADSIDVATETAGAALCLDLNSAGTSPNVAPHGIAISETAGTFRLEDLGGSGVGAATVKAFVEARNTGVATVSGSFDTCNDH